MHTPLRAPFRCVPFKALRRAKRRWRLGQSPQPTSPPGAAPVRCVKTRTTSVAQGSRFRLLPGGPTAARLPTPPRPAPAVRSSYSFCVVRSSRSPLGRCPLANDAVPPSPPRGAVVRSGAERRAEAEPWRRRHHGGAG